MRYEHVLKPILMKKIEEAVEQTDNEMGNGSEGYLLPWLGKDYQSIMADAAIAVLRGMQDAQDYLAEEGLLE